MNREDLEYKLLKIREWKQAEEDENILEGYAAVFNVVDAGGDKILPGAFKKTIKERVPAGKVKLFDTHDWRAASVLGTVIAAKEDDYGLFIRAKFSGEANAQSIRRKILEGHLSGLSIGYRSIKEEYESEDGRTVRVLKEVKLFETSVVPFPMAELAEITAVKALVPFQNLALAEEDKAWDAAGARKRIAAWAGGPEKEDVDWGKYRKAFLWWDKESPEEFGSYKFAVADVADGKLLAIPRGIFAAAAVLMGGRGGTKLPEADQNGMKTHLARYYKKLDRTPPWERDKGALTAMIEMMDAGTLEAALSVKEGRVLSSRNRGLIKEVLGSLGKLRQSLQDLYDAAEPPAKASPGTHRGEPLSALQVKLARNRMRLLGVEKR